MTKYFNKVDIKADFPSKEKERLDGWYKKGVVKEYLSKNKHSDKYFSFLDGPITANNPMGVHHAWGRTYKDLWQRYRNMRGFRQRFQNGFDCQGLWVEVEVEKELGLRTKKDIENLVPGDKEKSIAKFVELCKERVLKFADIQTQQSRRLGYFMDWENSYFTMSDENNYMIWHFLKVCHGNGWIYKGEDSVPWCPRCETAISQHEMLTEDYKEVVHASVYMTFPIKGKENELLLVWTTTPWTIPANIAVAVDKDIEYSLVESRAGKNYWLATETVERVMGEDAVKTIKKVKGGELVGLIYRGAFDEIGNIKKVAENSDNFHTVVPTDNLILPITVTEGTGLVHTAVSAGAEDFRLGKKLQLPMIPVIDDTASYIEGLGFLSGLNAKKHPELILDYLKERDGKDNQHWIYKIENYKHRYPACWRCKTELVWKVAEEWYIAMDKKGLDNKTLRQKMIEVAKSINWLPKFGLDRELDWLSNMHDWLISKPNRYWGLSLPIYECDKCGNFEVIGSPNELKEKSIEGWEDFEGHSPHKPYIDKVKIKCSKCNEVVERVKDVGNPWLDAGIVSYSTITKDNKGKPLYLSDRKTWRKWFPADFITESFPGQFKNWFYALIAMSTVLENERPFETVLGFATLLAEDGRPMHKSWGNSIEFNEGAEKIGVDVMRWMFVRQDPTENLLFGYRVADEVRRKFHLKLWNIYNYFVTYADLDEWVPGESESSKSSNILDTWIRTRLGEVVAKVTQGLDNYDAKMAALEIEVFVDDLSNWYIRRSRERTGYTATSANDRNDFYNTLYFVLVILSKITAPFIPFISDEIYTNLTKQKSVHTSDWPYLDPVKNSKLLDDMKNIRLVAEKAHAIRKDKKIPVRQPLNKLSVTAEKALNHNDLLRLLEDELNIKSINWNKGENTEMKINLDTKITPELELEARTRELIRRIQQERKEKGIDLTQIIVVTSPWVPDDNKLIEKIKKFTYTRELLVGEFSVELV